MLTVWNCPDESFVHRLCLVTGCLHKDRIKKKMRYFFSVTGYSICFIEELNLGWKKKKGESKTCHTDENTLLFQVRDLHKYLLQFYEQILRTPRQNKKMRVNQNVGILWSNHPFIFASFDLLRWEENEVQKFLMNPLMVCRAIIHLQNDEWGWMKFWLEFTTDPLRSQYIWLFF